MSSIHLYFHSPCFDGAASAAIATAYFEEVKGDSPIHLHGVNYHLKDPWKRSAADFLEQLESDNQPWMKTGNYDPKDATWLAPLFSERCGIVDFLYHPAASFWFDHHGTTFLDERFKQHCENDPPLEFAYDSQATSCALLLWEHWRKELTTRTEHFQSLVHWADRIDSARYESVQQAISLKEPALQINLALGTSRDATFSQALVGLMREKSLDEIAMLPDIRSEFEKGWRLQQQGLGRLKESVRLTDNGIVVFDVNTDNVLVNRYAPFCFFPDARYSAGISRHEGKAKITTMRNPWKEFPCAPLGQLCAPLGGGGHQRVGSILVGDRDPQDVLQSLLNAVAAWEVNEVAETAQ